MATGTGKTHYSEALVLNALYRNTAFTPPANLWLGLLTAAPDDSQTITEVSGGSYARQPIAFGAPANQSPSGAQVANSALITFPAATAGWGTVGWWGIFDTVSGGNMVFKEALAAAVTVVTSQQPTFPAGSLVILED